MTAGVASMGTTTRLRRRSTRPRSGGATSPVAWEPDQDLGVHEWIRAGKRLGAMTRCSQWWLGDWVRYGTGRWGEKYKEAARITGYDVQSLRNIAYVAGRVEASRRRDNLTWSHHAEISSLDPEEQERWLDLAESERLSVSDLRVELRAARRRSESRAEPPEMPRRRATATSERDADLTVTCPECRHEFKPPADR